MTEEETAEVDDLFVALSYSTAFDKVLVAGARKAWHSLCTDAEEREAEIKSLRAALDEASTAHQEDVERNLLDAVCRTVDQAWIADQEGVVQSRGWALSKEEPWLTLQQLLER